MDKTVDLMPVLRNVAEKFRIGSDIISYEVVLNGNINYTYKVLYRAKNGCEKYCIIQRINDYVFTRPDEIMDNIDHVTGHIAEHTPGDVHLHFHHTEDGKNWFRDEQGHYWRLSNYIDSVTYSLCDNLDTLRHAGAAFGKFQTDLSDFDASKLVETIPNFHNTPKRIADLEKAAAADPVGRAASVADELAFVAAHKASASALYGMLEAGELPLRGTHNDTKINNVLFDRETLTPLAVVDLDTVMPGLAAYDFGDAIRAAASTTDEDEADLSKVTIDMAKYTAFAEGFIGQTAGSLTQAEIDTLALGAYTIAVELGVRFLTDYIDGDKYFHVNNPKHNLVRARCQFKLASEMFKRLDEMSAIAASIAAKAKGNGQK